MSRVKTIIEVTHTARVTVEKTITTPVRCSYCNGRGYFQQRNDRLAPELCPDCAGTGNVRANITINWEPATLPKI